MTSETKSGNTGLAFIVGGLVVAVGIIAYFVFSGGEIGIGGGGDSTTVTIESNTGGGEAAAPAEGGGAPAGDGGASTGN